MTTVAQAVGRTLARHGVDTAFGLIGSGNFAVTNALCERGAQFHAARHENGALCMADGWARVTGRVGVVTVHQGPGLTNTITGLTEAAKSRTPLLVLAGAAPAAALTSNFRIDQDALVASVGALPERIHGPETAVADAARALRRAVGERRPVVLMMPIDVAELECADGDAPSEAAAALYPPAPAPEAVAAVADLLAAARRPAIVAGRGAALAGAREPLVALGERVGAVLATSAQAAGLFAGEAYDLGISGGFSTPLAQRVIPQADLVLAFGAAITRWTTRHGTLIGPDAKVVQVDLDEHTLGWQRPVDIGVVADAATAATALLAELDRRGVRAAGFRTPELAEEIAARRWRDEPYDDTTGGGRIDPRTLTIALDDLLPADRTVAVDSGHFMGYAPMYLRLPDAASFVFTQAFQSVGLGLASGIGAAIGRPDRVCVAALGDGGALMALSELETVARLRLPMLLVIYNDAAYGAEVHHFEPHGHPLDLVRFPDTDFAALAGAAGAQAITVRAPEDLAPVSAWLERRAGPLLVDAKVDPTVRAEWLEDAFR